MPHFVDRCNRRYERSIILTSNRAPEESLALPARASGPDLFGDSLLALAGLDRLNHSAHVIVITGASFRAHHFSNFEKEVPSEP